MTTRLALGKGGASSTMNQSMSNGRRDGGYREDWKIDLFDWRNSSALILTAGTTPVIEVSSSLARITWAASDSAALLTTFKLDGSFEDINSELQLVASMLQTGSTDTITVTASITATRDGYGTVGPFTATKVLTKSGLLVERAIFNFSGLTDSNGKRLEPGDNCTLTLTPSAHTTDAAYLYGSVLRRARNTGLTQIISNKDQRFVDYSL